MLQQVCDFSPIYHSHYDRPVPPSNPSGMIARGVAEANWPHSQRATRVEIVELTWRRARESTPITRIAEGSCEDEYPAVESHRLQEVSEGWRVSRTSD